MVDCDPNLNSILNRQEATENVLEKIFQSLGESSATTQKNGVSALGWLRLPGAHLMTPSCEPANSLVIVSQNRLH
jgi:hypothetical protein